jgi:hypothetical protein
MQEKIKEPPCKGCLCLPMCRTKSYAQLHKTCSLVKLYLYKSNDISTSLSHRNSKFEGRIFELYKILKPIVWKIKVLKIKHSNVIHPTSKEYDEKTKIKETYLQKIRIEGVMR